MAEAFRVREFTEFPFEMSCVYLFRDPIDSACEGGRNPVGRTVREMFDIRWWPINALLRLGAVVHVTPKFLEVRVPHTPYHRGCTAVRKPYLRVQERWQKFLAESGLRTPRTR